MPTTPDQRERFRWQPPPIVYPDALELGIAIALHKIEPYADRLEDQLESFYSNLFLLFKPRPAPKVVYETPKPPIDATQRILGPAVRSPSGRRMVKYPHSPLRDNEVVSCDTLNVVS